MATITILQANVADGQRWWVKNWDDYAAYLRQKGRPVPIRHGIFITHDDYLDFSRVHGDFEKQVPLVYGIDVESVDFEIVDAEHDT